MPLGADDLMRVLLAYDGSPGARQALDLLVDLDPPDGTETNIVAVLRPMPVLVGRPTSLDLAEAERHATEALESELEVAARGLAAPGRTVEWRVLRGGPAETIIDEANRLDADLIVMGSRGHGPFKSALLGSVSTEVVNASTRPVLVARGTSVRRVVLATDGTDASALALEVVASWPIFADADITVVSVSEPTMGWATLGPVATSAYLLELEADLADERRAVHADMARAGADHLREAGRTATDEVRVGNPAHEIVQAADATGADLIVTGSRRSSARFPGALGSVARSVLQNAPISVLIVRHPMTAAAERAALEAIIDAEGAPDPGT